MLSLAVVALACLVGGYIGGTTGFGYALVVVPIISLATDPPTAIAVGLTVGGACSLFLAYHQRGSFRSGPAAILWITALVAMPAGVWITRMLSLGTLHVLVGVAVVASTIALLRGARIKRRRTGLAVAGTVSGALATSTGMHGPPVVIACGAVGMDHREVRATSAGIIGVQAALAMVVGTVGGMFDERTLQVVPAAAVPTALGWWAGARAFAGLSAVLVQRMTYGLLAVSAATSVWTGVEMLRA